MKYGGGLLIFGILVLPAEYDLLELFSQATKFGFAPGVPDSIKATMQGFL